MKAISLFTGAGGMDVGMIKAGFSIVAASELNKTAVNTYLANHKNVNVFEGDIHSHIALLSEYRTQKIDLVFGGPPCQGFSVAGKMDSNDPRSQLVYTFCDVVDKIQPKSFVMENVKSLGTLEKFQHIKENILNFGCALGYKTKLVILNAKDFGVPQSRERVFFIGTKSNEACSYNDFEPFKRKAKSVRATIKHLGRAGSPDNPHVTKAKITLAAKPILRKSPYAGMLFNGQGRPLNPDSWSTTLPASMGGNRTPIIDEQHLYENSPSWVENYHMQLMDGVSSSLKKIEAPSYLRRLTITEAALLQTFPPSYIFCGSQSNVFTQIGNAVPCDLAEVVGKVVMNKLTGKIEDSEYGFLHPYSQ